MEYPKINTIWKRDEKTHHVLEGDYSCPEFGAIDSWTVTEKVDGTNIRVIYHPPSKDAYERSMEHPDDWLQFRGKTDNAQIPPPLLAYLRETFTPEKLKPIFPEDTTTVVLFGEGFGGKIQHGGRYRKDESFVLFDVWIDGWWLEFPNVMDIANKLGIQHVPFLGIMTTDLALQCVSYVMPAPLLSRIAEDKTFVIEGIVATSHPMMMFRKGGVPIRWKLKVKDFAKKVKLEKRE